MSDSMQAAPTEPPPLPQADLAAKVDGARAMLMKAHKEGAAWFYWIAGLSLINSVVILMGSQWSFLIGLGVTQVIDGVALGLVMQIGEQSATVVKGIAFAMDVFVACTFVLWGFLAGRLHRWAYVVGMILYAMDGLIFLLVRDYLSLGFHVFALVYLFKGFKACGQLTRLDELAAGAAAEAG